MRKSDEADASAGAPRRGAPSVPEKQQASQTLKPNKIRKLSVDEEQ